MADSHYSADSAHLPPLSLRPGQSGSRKEHPAKTVDFPLSLDDATPLPANYLLAGGASVCVGVNAHGARRLPKRTIGADPGLSGPSPIATSSID